MAQSLHAAFLQAIEKRQIDAAYVYGLRLASLALELLPRHPAWKQPTVEKEKRRLTTVVDSTIQQMEVLKQRMDAEELMRLQKIRQEKEQHEEQQRLAVEAERQRQEAVHQQLAQERERRLETHRKEQAAALEVKKKAKEQSIQQSALAKLQAMQPRISSTTTATSNSQSSTQPTTTLTPEHVRSKAPETSAVPPSHQTDNATPATEKLSLSGKEDSSSPTIQRTLTPRSSKEQATIDLLYRAIQNQEKRIHQIESMQIPQLIAATKANLKKFCCEEDKSAAKINQDKTNPHRQAALQCLARKKKLQRQAEASKAAVFQMETQIFMLENAMEDRLVQATLEEASQAMSNLQKLTGVDTPVQDFAQQLSESLAVDTSEIALDSEEEDDLLEELQGLMTSSDGVTNEGTKTTSVLSEEDAGVLALPPALTSPLPAGTAAPDASDAIEEESSSKTSDSVRNLFKAVLG
jgi:hypothetical protein